jgi:hypothetical protein
MEAGNQTEKYKALGKCKETFKIVTLAFHSTIFQFIISAEWNSGDSHKPTPAILPIPQYSGLFSHHHIDNHGVANIEHNPVAINININNSASYNNNQPCGSILTTTANNILSRSDSAAETGGRRE